MSECVFCDSYKTIKKLDTDMGLDAGYSVAMIRCTASGKKKRGKPESHTWGAEYKLNFCPECGRRLKEEEENG